MKNIINTNMNENMVSKVNVIKRSFHSPYHHPHLTMIMMVIVMMMMMMIIMGRMITIAMM